MQNVAVSWWNIFTWIWWVLFYFILRNIRGQSESAFCGQKLLLPDVLRLTFVDAPCASSWKKPKRHLRFCLTVQSDKHSPCVTVAMKLRWAGPSFLCVRPCLYVWLCVYIYYIFQISRINISFCFVFKICKVTGDWIYNINVVEFSVLTSVGAVSRCWLVEPWPLPGPAHLPLRRGPLSACLCDCVRLWVCWAVKVCEALPQTCFIVLQLTRSQKLDAKHTTLTSLLGRV